MPQNPVVATLAPNVGHGMLGFLEPTNEQVSGVLQSIASVTYHVPPVLEPRRLTQTQGLFDEYVDVRDKDRPMTVPRDHVSCHKDIDRPQSAPMSWMTAITARVNSLWRTFYGGSALPPAGVHKSDGVLDMPLSDVEPMPFEEAEQLLDVVKPSVEHPKTGRVWRLNSETVIPLDEPYERRPDPKLDLRIPSRSRRTIQTQADCPIKASKPSHDADNDKRGAKTSDQRRGQLTQRTVTTGPKDHRNPRRRSKEKSVSYDKRHKIEDRSHKRTDSTQSARSTGQRQSNSDRFRNDRSPPSSDDKDEDSSDDDRRSRRSRRPRRLRRRPDPSPDDDGDGTNDDGSSSEDERERIVAGSRHFRIKLQKFDGTGSWESWWAHFQNCASYNRWTERDQLAFMKGALTGNAAQVLWDTGCSKTSSLDKLVSVLKSRYSGERQAEKYRAELQIRRRRCHESLSDLHQDIRRLVALAYPQLTAEAREEIACDHFTNALSDPDFALKVKERTPKSLDEALNVALRLEAWAKSVGHSRQDEERPDRPRGKARAAAKTENTKMSTVSESDDRVTKLETAMTEIREQLSKIAGKPVSSNKATSTLGTMSKGFPSPRVKTEAAASAEEKPPQSLIPGQMVGRPVMQNVSQYQYPPVICYGCGLPGHIKRNCPTELGLLGPPPNTLANRGSKDFRGEANVYIMMKLMGKKIPCLVDSGCDLTIVPKSLTDRFKYLEAKPSTRQIWAANNTAIQINGETELPFELDGRCIWTPVLISEDVEEVMLGIDWLESHKCVWNFNTRHLTIDGQETVTLRRKGHFRCQRVLAQEYQEIPPQSQKDIMARVTLLSTQAIPEHIIVDTRELRPGLYVGRTLLPASHHNVKVRVANTTGKPQAILQNSCLGPAVPVTLPTSDRRNVGSDAEGSSSSNPMFTDLVEPVLKNLPTDITVSQRKKVIGFLQEFDDMFSRGTYDMGRTTLVEHTIDTGSNRPIRQPLRRHPWAHLDEIDRQEDELLQNDFIESAASPWASNVVLVRKKDGSHRLCVDYRRLNAVPYKDSYPLPHIDTCLGSVNGAVWFSTLDLRSGYHNIPIQQDHRDKTAFITRRGCFRYKVMPFGLTCAPSVFQRWMDLVLSGLTYETCLVYLDDIIVFSRDFDTHLSRLREIFIRLRSANLKVHIKKCSLFQRRVNFLGHVLTETGIEVQPEKVEAVNNWPTPRNLTELWSFVGLCSYYWQFIAGFADLAAPLHALTRKNAQFKWGLEQEEAFHKLKERLTSAPILGMPQDEGVYYLDTDASDFGLSAVLSQEQNGQEVVLAYASRSLTRTERNYEVTRRELLAVIYGLRTYRQYLLGRRFVIRTDHSALQSLRRTPEPIGQQARWQAFIEQFDFEIRHRPGTQHRNADALS